MAAVAPIRKTAPTRTLKKRRANAIAKAAVAWSLGKEGSPDRCASKTVLAGGAANGRSRNQKCPMIWLATSPRPAAAQAQAVASRQRSASPGRSKSHRTRVAAAKIGTLQEAKPETK